MSAGVSPVHASCSSSLLERDDSSAPDGVNVGRFHAANDEPSRKVIPLLRSFTVFNEAQVEGPPAHLTADSPSAGG